MAKQTQRINISLNLWWLVGLLGLIIVGMVVLWRPWASARGGDRTVSVTGDSTLKAEPDEFQFYPSYEFRTSDKPTGLTELTAKSNEVVAGLKKLGVTDKDIKSNASSYRDYYFFNTETNQHIFSLSLTVAAHTRDMAQKVQDYLISTTPTGQVSPQAQFSKTKQKELAAKARTEAIADARRKAAQQAGDLDLKLGKVKSVEENDNGGLMPMYNDKSALMSATVEPASIGIQAGENEYNLSVRVVYYVR